MQFLHAFAAFYTYDKNPKTYPHKVSSNMEHFYSAPDWAIISAARSKPR